MEKKNIERITFTRNGPTGQPVGGRPDDDRGCRGVNNRSAVSFFYYYYYYLVTPSFPERGESDDFSRAPLQDVLRKYHARTHARIIMRGRQVSACRGISRNSDSAPATRTHNGKREDPQPAVLHLSKKGPVTAAAAAAVVRVIHP